jgi:hypothetical protein
MIDAPIDGKSQLSFYRGNPLKFVARVLLKQSDFHGSNLTRLTLLASARTEAV